MDRKGMWGDGGGKARRTKEGVKRGNMNTSVGHVIALVKRALQET